MGLSRAAGHRSEETLLPLRNSNNGLDPIQEGPEEAEEGYYYHTPRPSRPRSNSMLKMFRDATGPRRRQTAVDTNRDPLKFASLSNPQSYSSWTALVLHIVRRIVVLAPILILLFFGIVHVFQVILGRAKILWDDESHDDFLPEWGNPGHNGEFLAHYPTDATRGVIPIGCHSHNDYWRRIPLFEAIHYGCTGVEADVWLFDDDLFVGHGQGSLTRNRTFRSLYVDPLVQLLDKQNPSTEFGQVSGHGVFDTEPDQTLTLLIDFKTDGHKTWPVVEAQLGALREKGYLSYFNGTDHVRGAITVVATGNAPFELVTGNSTYRDMFFDAPLEKLWEMPQKVIPSKNIDGSVHSAKDEMPSAIEVSTSEDKKSDFDLSNSYYASVSFTKAVGFVWRGHLSARQMEIIRGQIRGAKKRGLKVRYWDTPPWPISARNHVWHVLMKEGADMLNADDVRAASRMDWRKWRHEWW